MTYKESKLNYLADKLLLETDLQDLVLLRLVDFASQAAVGDGIMDDWLVGLGAGLLE